MSDTDYKLYICVQCGFEYDEAKGWPQDGIAPGTYRMVVTRAESAAIEIEALEIA